MSQCRFSQTPHRPLGSLPSHPSLQEDGIANEEALDEDSGGERWPASATPPGLPFPDRAEAGTKGLDSLVAA